MASLEEHDVMISGGLEAWLDLGCGCRRPLPNSNKQITRPLIIRGRVLSFPRRPPGLEATESSVLLVPRASATRGSSGLNLLAPDTALGLAFDWLFLRTGTFLVGDWFLCSSHSSSRP